MYFLFTFNLLVFLGAFRASFHLLVVFFFFISLESCVNDKISKTHIKSGFRLLRYVRCFVLWAMSID